VPVDKTLGGAERVELERLEAFREDTPRGLEKRLRRPLGAVPAIGIAEHGVAHLPAEQLMDGNAQVLAHDVPAGDFDSGDDGPVDVAAIERNAVEHAL